MPLGVLFEGRALTLSRVPDGFGCSVCLLGGVYDGLRSLDACSFVAGRTAGFSGLGDSCTWSERTVGVFSDLRNMVHMPGRTRARLELSSLLCPEAAFSPDMSGDATRRMMVCVLSFIRFCSSPCWITGRLRASGDTSTPTGSGAVYRRIISPD